MKTFLENIRHPDFTNGFRDRVVLYFAKVVGRRITDAEADKWIESNAGELVSQFDAFMAEAISRTYAHKAPVLNASLSFEMKDKSKIQVFVYDSGQTCATNDHNRYRFGGDDTAGMVYVHQSVHGYRADEHNITEPTNWAWIQKWMKRGFVAAGFMDESQLTAEEKEN